MVGSLGGSHGRGARQPGEAVHQTLKDESELQDTAKAKDFELDEQRQKKRFRSIMVWLVPFIAFGWLGMILWTILSGRIQGLQVGIALGATGAGLLTLLGLQIAWANSQKDTKTAHAVEEIVKFLAKRLRE